MERSRDERTGGGQQGVGWLSSEASGVTQKILTKLQLPQLALVKRTAVGRFAHSCSRVIGGADGNGCAMHVVTAAPVPRPAALGVFCLPARLTYWLRLDRG